MRVLIAALVFIGAFPQLQKAAAADRSTIADFYGSYFGRGTARKRGVVLGDRVASLAIGPTKDGFRISWLSGFQLGSNRVTKSKTHTLNFRKTAHPGRWHAMENTSLLNGGYTAWARLKHKVLVVYVVSVDQQTGQLLAAVWRRTLVPGGLSIRFHRLRDTRIIRTATARARREK